METITGSRCAATLFTRGAAHGDILYAITEPEDGQALWDALPVKPAALAAIHGMDWNRDLSPWAAPACFAGGQAFAGQGKAFLAELLGEILPDVESRLGLAPRRRLLAGYSLAGLFALYSLTQTDAFQGAASVSGSLWFDGWPDYLQSHLLKADKPTVFLSLGEKEERTRNPRLCTVGDAARQSYSLLTQQGCTAVLEWNPGGHFHQPPARMARAAQWLIGQP